MWTSVVGQHKRDKFLLSRSEFRLILILQMANVELQNGLEGEKVSKKQIALNDITKFAQKQCNCNQMSHYIVHFYEHMHVNTHI